MMIDKLFLLFAGHFLADFPLQGEYIATMKNRHCVPKNIPEGQIPTPVWFYALTAHAFIHGLMVFIITQSLLLTFLEIVTHWIFDFMKCENITNPHTDQLLHFWVLVCTWVYQYVWV